MIFQLPQMPPLGPNGRFDQTLVLLMGSQGNSKWQSQIARELEFKLGPKVATIRTDTQVQGVLSHSGYPPEYLLPILHQAYEMADLTVVWIDKGPVWTWLELGYLAQQNGRHSIIWGIDTEIQKSYHHAGHLQQLLEIQKWPIHDSLDTLLSRVKGQLQESRMQ